MDRQLRIKRYLAFNAISEGQWLARDGEASQWVINGPPWLGKMLHLLEAGGCTLEDLQSKLADAAQPHEVRSAARDLTAEGVIETVGTNDTCGDTPDAVIETYLSRWDIGPRQVRRVLKGCRLAVVGAGDLAQDMLKALVGSGIDATVIDDLDRLDADAAGKAMLIAAPSSPGDERCEAVNRIAIEHDLPWLRVSCDAHHGQVGPLFVPRQTACWNCFERRLASNREHSVLHAVGRPAENGNQSIKPAHPPPLFARCVVSHLGALEVLRFLFGHESNHSIGKLLVLSFSDLRISCESVLKLPDCPTCIDRRGDRISVSSSGVDQATASQRNSVGNWRRVLVGRHCGVIRSVREVPARWDDPRVHIVSSQPSNTEILDGGEAPGGAGGVGLTPDAAWSGAIGEAAERYCASFVPGNDLKTATWRDFDADQAIDPHQMALYSDWQYDTPGFPCARFDRDICTTWTHGRRLTADLGAGAEPCWLPAQCVYLSAGTACGERPITVCTSTGLATAETLEKALLAGLCEIIERDAFVIAWQNSLSAPRVDIHAAELQWLRDVLEERLLWPRIQYEIGDLTADAAVPTYAVISHGPSEDGLIVSFGAASHPRAGTALTKALLEAAMGRIYIRQLVRQDPHKAYRRDFADVRTFTDHAQFYTRRPRYRRHLTRLVSDRTYAQLDMLSNSEKCHDATELERVAERLRSLGLDAYWRELTTADVASAQLHVVRVLVPGMQLLHGDHSLPFLGGNRRRHPEQVFAWAPTPRHRRQRQNGLPHPYP